MLNVSEIFTSIQGESTLSGLPCTFIRLAGCNLRCAWCDTKYSYEDNEDSAISQMSIDDIVSEVEKYQIGLVEITGGEPLLQPETPALCERLLDEGYGVMLETNGSKDIGAIDDRVFRIVDVKCPGSGAGGSFFTGNLERLTCRDELKFVLASIEDAEWAKRFCIDNSVLGTEDASGCEVIFSPVSSDLSYRALADWMVENKLDGIRLGIQLHKIIWGDARQK